MTTITAQIIADSINEQGNRLTTFQLRYPRWIHSEGRTHRLINIDEGDFEAIELRTPSPMSDPDISRNASSSRATPVYRLIQDILDDPAIPMFWGANQRGMQAGAECTESVRLFTPDLDVDFETSWDYFQKSMEDDSPELPASLILYDLTREDAWKEAMYRAIDVARAFDKAGYHKQIVNRLLEPFSHINVVWTATEWTNFYGLRRHNDAEPHIHLLADRMWEAQLSSIPNLLKPGEWHLPYVSDEELAHYGIAGAISLAVARCASVSYKTVDGQVMTAERALSLHTKLVGAQPLHASPCEHVAQADKMFSQMVRVNDNEPVQMRRWEYPHLHGNFKGFIQYRKTLPGEHISEYL